MRNSIKLTGLIINMVFILLGCGKKEELNTITVQMPSSSLESIFYPEIAQEFTEKTGIIVEF